MLLSAVGLAWSVAVRRALSPRTALRQGLQYALARRTLAILMALPGVLLAISRPAGRDQPLAAIVSGQPLFYVTAPALLTSACASGERARQWPTGASSARSTDARGILLALASRVPAEADPRALVRGSSTISTRRCTPNGPPCWPTTNRAPS
ncbi:MAG: hypothetical protein R2712_05775 [Vicinamibacterales bacterium]